MSDYIGGCEDLQGQPHRDTPRAFFIPVHHLVPACVPVLSSRQLLLISKQIRKNILLKRVCRLAKFPRLGGRVARNPRRFSPLQYRLAMRSGSSLCPTISSNREIIVRICPRVGEQDRKKSLHSRSPAASASCVFFLPIHSLRWNNGFGETKERLLLLDTGTVSRANKVSCSLAELEMNGSEKKSFFSVDSARRLI